MRSNLSGLSLATGMAHPNPCGAFEGHIPTLGATTMHTTGAMAHFMGWLKTTKKNNNTVPGNRKSKFHGISMLPFNKAPNNAVSTM